MKFTENNPPREFEVGFKRKIAMKDCGSSTFGQCLQKIGLTDTL